MILLITFLDRNSTVLSEFLYSKIFYCVWQTTQLRYWKLVFGRRKHPKENITKWNIYIVEFMSHFQHMIFPEQKFHRFDGIFVQFPTSQLFMDDVRPN